MIARIDQTSGDVLAGGKRYIPFMLAIANDAGSVKKKKKKKKKRKMSSGIDWGYITPSGAFFPLV